MNQWKVNATQFKDWVVNKYNRLCYNYFGHGCSMECYLHCVYYKVFPNPTTTGYWSEPIPGPLCVHSILRFKVEDSNAIKSSHLIKSPYAHMTLLIRVISQGSANPSNCHRSAHQRVLLCAFNSCWTRRQLWGVAAEGLKGPTSLHLRYVYIRTQVHGRQTVYTYAKHMGGVGVGGGFLRIN